MDGAKGEGGRESSRGTEVAIETHVGREGGRMDMTKRRSML